MEEVGKLKWDTNLRIAEIKPSDPEDRTEVVVGGLSWLPATHSAAPLLPLLNRRRGENKMKKLMSRWQGDHLPITVTGRTDFGEN